MSSSVSFNPSQVTRESDPNILYLSLALFPAIEREEIDKIKTLLKAGAHLNYRDANSQTLLHAAAREGNREIVELFLSKGVDKNLEDSNCFTASRIAEVRGHKSIASLIDSFEDKK